MTVVCGDRNRRLVCCVTLSHTVGRKVQICKPRFIYRCLYGIQMRWSCDFVTWTNETPASCHQAVSLRLCVDTSVCEGHRVCGSSRNVRKARKTKEIRKTPLASFHSSLFTTRKIPMIYFHRETSIFIGRERARSCKHDDGRDGEIYLTETVVNLRPFEAAFVLHGPTGFLAPEQHEISQVVTLRACTWRLKSLRY